MDAEVSKRPRWLRAVQWGALGIALALGLGGFVADAVRSARVPSDGDVAAATRAIREGFAAGDAVYATPTWYTLPWHALEGMGPGTEAWPYPALLMSEDLDPLEALSYRRLWVMASFDRAADVPESIADAASGRVDIPTEAEHVALARYDLQPVERLRTLTRERESVLVRRGAPGTELAACKWRGDRHRCGRDPGLDLRIEDRIVHHRQVAWLMAIPGPENQLLELEWPGLPANGTWLYLRAGWTMEGVRHPEGKPTTVVVWVDGREVDRFVLEPHHYWLERRAIRLGSAEPVTVVFQTFTEDNGWRELMLEADVLATLPEPLRRWATHVVE